MQAANTNELPERSRYYQGIIDVDLLKSGQKYKCLKTSFIIFICIDDIFKRGLAKYTFENLCLEDKKTRLDDRSQKLFFISKNYDKILDERQKAFLRMVTSNLSSNDFTKKIERLVADAKRNAQWRKQYMDWEREKTYILDDGIEKGRAQKSIEIARNMLKKQYPVSDIVEITGLSLEEVMALESKDKI